AAFRPALRIRRTNQARSLVCSLLAALGSTTIIFAVLAVISVTFKALTKEADDVLKVSSFSTKTPPDQDQTDPPLFSLARPRAPASPTAPNSPIPIAPDLKLTPPVPESVPDFALAWEELEFEEPFEETPEPVEEKKKSVKPRPDTAAVAQKNAQDEARRRAALAKKIVRTATVISQATPAYPSSARRKKQEGQVVVTVTVGSSGRVTSSYVSKSSQVAALDSAALSAARRFRFNPAIKALGEAVSTKKTIPFTFKLSN
ncbi:energy transducer TonB, partial [Akkermansiaceae bacterium]|nr:energy transducer TonB [Akkermansiaceae bacterium]